MSTFGKPLTPRAKNPPTTKPPISVKAKSMSNICTSDNNYNINLTSSTKVLEEVNVFLYLETIKRSRANEAFLKQKVEEAYKIFEERRHKYRILLAKYAMLVKLACTNKVLLNSDLIEVPTESAPMDAKHVKEKLSNFTASDYIISTELSKFKQILQSVQEYKNLPIRSSELSDLQNASNDIQNSIASIEVILEKSVKQGFDHFADILDISNYPKLQIHHSVQTE